jgi:hypothetical protein
MKMKSAGWHRSAGVLSLALLLLAACAPSASSSPEASAPPSSDESVAASATASVVGVVECDAPEGSVNDVASEPPGWRELGDYREWTTADGCLLRIDVLGDRPGPEHCGFESARVIVTGIPVGERYTDASDDAEFIRDPDNVFGDPEIAAAFDPNAELPADAEDTGFRNEGSELWIVPGDDSAIYLVTGESVERWPHDPEPTGCA